MDSSAIAFLLGAIITFAGGLVTYLIGRRRTSGNLAYSTPQQLWDVSQELISTTMKLRKDSEEENFKLRSAILKLENENESLKTEIAMLKQHIDRLEIQVNGSEQ